MNNIDALKIYKKDLEKIIAREEKKLQKENEKNKVEYDVVFAEYGSENAVMEMFGCEAITEKEKNRLIEMLNTGGPNAPTSNLYLDILKRDLKSINIELKYPDDSDHVECVSDPMVVELEKKIEELVKENKQLEINIEGINYRAAKQNELDLIRIKETKQMELKLRELQNKSVPKKHNERGAGRKPTLSDQDREMIKMYRLQHKTIKELSAMFNCSTGLISKIINE